MLQLNQRCRGKLKPSLSIGHVQTEEQGAKPFRLRHACLLLEHLTNWIHRLVAARKPPCHVHELWVCD